MTSPGYSDAPRCPECSFKAVLSDRQASTLAKASKDGVLAFKCPYGYGWHLQIDLSVYPSTRRPPLADYP